MNPTARSPRARLLNAIASAGCCGLITSLSLVAPAVADAKAKRARPAVSHASFGLADQDPQTFNDPRVAALGIKTDRIVLAWDAMSHPAQAAVVDTWMAAARIHGIRPLIVFEHSALNPMVLPSPRAYLAAFTSFHRAYPWVTDYQPWNEENHRTQPTWNHPAVAAAFYNLVKANCRGCQVTAADLLDSDRIDSWLKVFMRTAHHPRLWGLHSYHDVNAHTQSITRKFLKRVPGNIWFTETGGLVWRRQAGQLIWRGPAKAATGAAYLFKLAALSPRIQRIYYYHWRSPGNPNQTTKATTWDSGLVDASGKARPALATIAGLLHRRLPPAPRVAPATQAPPA